MAEIGRWNGHIFEVNQNEVFSFSELSISASCETEDKESSKQKYASRQAANATEISMTVALNTHLGVDVRDEIMGFVEDARAGSKDYFYIGNAKLVPYKLMLTEASASEIDIAAGGKWTHASLQLKMKQAEKDGSTASSTGSSSGSSGSKKSSGSDKAGTGASAGQKHPVEIVLGIIDKAKETSQTNSNYQKEKAQYETKKSTVLPGVFSYK